MRVRTRFKRDGIVACAAALFRDVGFHRASMSEIAARLGGSKTTLYGYFQSKHALFIAVADAEATAYFGTLLTDLINSHMDTRAALQRLGEKTMAFVLQPRSIAARRMIIAVALHSPSGKDFYENGPKKGVEFIGKYLQSLAEKGELRAVDAWVMAQHLIALLESELVPEFVCGAETGVPKSARIAASVKRAVDTFLSAYQT